MKVESKIPDGEHCTGCPCSLHLPQELARAERKYWVYGCVLIHRRCKSGGEYDNYAIKHKNCPGRKKKR